MKRHWNIDELIDDWTLQSGEMALVTQVQIAKNRLGLALLLKWFQYENRYRAQRLEPPSTRRIERVSQIDLNACAD